MSIISVRFVFFVLALLVVYYIMPKKIRWTILLLGSIFFYYLSSEKLIIYILLSSLSIYLLGILIDYYNTKNRNINKDLTEEEKNRLKKKYKFKKRIVLLIGILVNILFIILTKYSVFILENINAIFNRNFNISNLFVPLGISYYTLEAISYITDVYRGKTESSKNPLKVLLFLIYFPKIIQGPICRFKDLSKEIYENNSLDFNKILLGIDLIIYGVFKKMVIADRAGIFVNNIFGNTYGGITVVLAMILYTVQIYAEFSGCIDIVRGVSLLFSINLPENFKRPFFSKSIQEFWRLWHISLGAWLKEYVFYPISLSKLNMKVSAFCKKYLNTYLYKFICAAFPLLFVWLVNGIWHGASYKYVIYGMYYYIIMMIGLLCKPIFDKFLNKYKINKYLLDGFRIIRTCIIVVVGMTLFRATTITEFAQMIISVFKVGNGIENFGLVKIDFIILLISNCLVLIVGILEEKKIINLNEGFTKNPILRAIVYTILICLIVIFGIYGEGYDASNFIYGAF